MSIKHRSKKPIITKTVTIIFLTCFIFSILPWPSVEAAPSLTRKWAGYVAGGGEALLTADVLSQYAGEEVFHAGGAVAPNNGGRVTCLNGRTGAQIWTRTISNVGDTCQIQMSDVDHNGDLEIIVPLQQPAGVYILHAENGAIMYSNTALGGGRIDSGPVCGDIDGNGFPDVFLPIMGYETQPTTGKIIRYEWNPSTSRVEERDRVTVWHPCAGGLSLADTDNDGRWELYMNERDAYFGDGSWGRGLTSFWADDLTMRWCLYDWGASSNKPMLADVNHDGIVDVVSTDLSAGVCVLNSSDGHPLKNADGVTLSQTRISGRHNHYQSSIYDIDGDGNIEVLSGDGFEGDFDFITVFDLYDWTLDASINTTLVGGRSWKGPTVGELTGDGLMDIIVTTFDHLNNTNNGTVQVYDRNYNLVFANTGLRHRAIDSVVQDIDRNDNGLNELLVLTQGGVIYCFETPGIASNPRARSEVQFYSESRCGASEYVPYERPWPDVTSSSPIQGAVNVATGLNQLSFRLNHPLSQTMSYTVTTSPYIGSGSGNNVGNGLRTVLISGLIASTTYRWQVNVTDSSGHKTSKYYWFTTSPTPLNAVPSQGTPTLTSSEGQNSDTEDLIAQSQNTVDPDGDDVTSIYNWLKGSGSGVSITNLLLPFDSKPDAAAVYSGTATTRDYSGRNNNGNVFGATWTQGIVGGAFSFDGKDFIRIEEQNNSLDGADAWSAISIEFWIKATTPGSNERLIWKPDRYESSSTSYRIDYRYRNTTDLHQLEFAWYVNTTASAGLFYYVKHNVTAGISDWHHVAFTYRSGVGLNMYLDGTVVASNLSSTLTGNIINTNGPLEIAFNGGSDFAGILDEVRLYPSQISGAFVNQRFLDTKDGSSSSSTIPSEDTAVGDIWRCQVTPNDGLADGTTRTSATLTVGSADPDEHIFVDGFESGSFSAWTGSSAISGSATVASTMPHSGVFSGVFSVNSGSGTRRAYCYRNLNNQAEVYGNAYVYIADGLPLSNGQSMWLVQFVDSAGNILASFGARADSTGTHWAVQSGNYPYAVSASGPSEGQWYSLQAHFTHASTGKTIVLTVNGVEVVSLSQNTMGVNNVASARFGLSYYAGTSTANVVVDEVVIDD